MNVRKENKQKNQIGLKEKKLEEQKEKGELRKEKKRLNNMR